MEASFFSKIALYFDHGGIWMYAILAAQLVSIAIIVERVIALYVKRKEGQQAIAEQFENDIRAGRLQSVYERAKAMGDQSVVAKATAVGVTAAMNLGGKDEIQNKMDEVLIKESSLVEKRIGYLTMLGNVGTLIGLLGTIVGMIGSFASLSNADQVTKATLLSASISEAMHCTAYGLIMAIPSLIAFAVLQSRANTLVEDMTEGSLKVYNWLSYAYAPVGLRNTRAKQNDQVQVDA